MDSPHPHASGGSIILELLQKRKLLKPEDTAKVHDLRARHSVSLDEALLRSELVTDEQIAQAYAEETASPIWTPPEGREGAEQLAALASLLPEKLCRERLIAPVHRVGSVLQVAAVNPTDFSLVEGLQVITEMHVDILVARFTHVQGALNLQYGARDVARELAAEVATESVEIEADVEQLVLDLQRPVPPTREGQIISLVNHVLEQAAHRHASDIHLEPYEESVRFRLRIDGRLVEMTPPPRPMFVPMISRLKILSRMDIAEKRIPQDGAFTIQHAGKKIDLRVSTVPSVWGEKMVIRLLNKGAVPLDMRALGFTERQAKDFEEALASPHGLVFVTGPTGSGKSTTLYTGLNLLNKPERNIVTVEDPVEYRFTGINQVQVKAQVGLTFGSALRAFLRQDPDVMMVGEVRDQETAEICLRAALTGHLVLSTLHTNDALTAINRLQDMGIEPFLLAATVRLLQAQRLVRRLCPACKKPVKLDSRTARKVGAEPDTVVYGPVGCDACAGVGYRGRVGIFEIIRVTPRLQAMIGEGAPLKDMQRAAREEGFEFLIDSGMRQVRNGLTSAEEMLTVTLAGDE
jgi:type IV pilus assembly protein PilB